MGNTEPVPTVMVGVGGAGVAVVEHTYKAILREMDWEDEDENTAEDYFKLHGFDSNDDSLEGLKEVGIGESELKDREEFFEANKSEYPYLSDEFEHSEEGSRRTRPIARYKFDNKTKPGFQEHLDTLEDIIDNHVDEVEKMDPGATSRLNIFFAHSLAGGTGSGTFPLFAALLSDLADNLGDNTDVYTAGIGVVIEPSHPAKQWNPGFRLNTYASMEDVRKMSSDEVTTLPVYSRTEIEGTIDERLENPETSDLDVTDPFDNYWLVGLNESLQGGEEEGDIENYLTQIDNTIAESILSISRLKDEKENWSASNGIVGSLGETEVGVPMEIMERYCRTLDDVEDLKQRLYGGEIPEKYRELERPGAESAYRKARHEQIIDIDDDIDEVIEQTIEENFTGTSDNIFQDIYSEVDDLGSDYEHVFTPKKGPEEAIEAIYESVETCDIAKLRVRDIFTEETEEQREKVREEYNNTIDELGSKNMYDVTTKDRNRTQVRNSLEREIPETIENLEQAKEALEFGLIGLTLELVKKIFFGSLILPPTKAQIQSKLDEAREDLGNLEDVTKYMTNLEKMEEKLDSMHIKTKEELREEVRELYNMKNSLDEDKRTLSNGATSTRLGYLPVNEETIEEDLSSEWLEDNINNIQDCFDEGLVDREVFEETVKDQMEKSYPWEETVMTLGDPDKMEFEFGSGDEEQTTWVLYHEDNEEITEEAVGDRSSIDQDFTSSGDGDDKLSYIANPYRVKIVSMYNVSHMDYLNLYQDLEALAEGGKLPIGKDGPYNDWRHAYAYPEWYDDDVRRAFAFDETITLYQPPELDWENDVDLSGLNQDADTYIEKYGIYHYLWEGILWDRFEKAGDDYWFKGWKETLSQTADDINQASDLRKFGPDHDTRDNWTDGKIGWEEILKPIQENMRQEKDIEIVWDLPEEMKTDMIG